VRNIHGENGHVACDVRTSLSIPFSPVHRALKFSTVLGTTPFIKINIIKLEETLERNSVKLRPSGFNLGFILYLNCTTVGKWDFTAIKLKDDAPSRLETDVDVKEDLNCISGVHSVLCFDLRIHCYNLWGTPAPQPARTDGSEIEIIYLNTELPLLPNKP